MEFPPGGEPAEDAALKRRPQVLPDTVVRMRR